MLAAEIDDHHVQETSDELLAHRAVYDLGAFSELYRRYLCRIYGFVRSQTPDEPTAEDLTAQTFFRAFSSASTFSGDGTYRSWLFRIAHNTLASWRVGRAKGPVVVENVPEHVDPAPLPSAVVLAGEERSLVWRLVSSLGPAQREVLALRYLEDLTIEEIADVTDRSRGAVRILLHRARNSLRRAIEDRRSDDN
jgi:RNA polymerase sigma-70 factor (ECF subfamily)